MGVREKPGRGWVAEVYVPGTGKYITRSAKTQREARALFAEMTVAVGQGKERPSSGKTLGDLLAAYLEHFDGSPSTKYGYGLIVKRLPESLTKLRLRQVTPQKLDRYYRELRKAGLGNRSIRNVHALLRAALGRAVRWGWMIGANPALNASPGPVAGNAGRVASMAEIEALMAAADPDLRLAIRLAAVTGARRSELAALEWRDVDFDAGTLAISRAVVDAGGRRHQKGTKTHQGRTIPLDATTLALLRERRGIGPVLRDAFDRPLSPRALSNRLDALAEKVGIEGEGFGWHSFRHFCATFLLGSHDVKTVSARLGHANPNVTLATYPDSGAGPGRRRCPGEALG